MAAETVPLAIPGGAPGPDIRPGRAAPAASAAGSGGSGPAGASATASQSAQSSDEAPSARDGSGGVSPHPDDSSDSPGKARSTKSHDPAGDSRAARRTGRGSGAAASSSPKTTAPAPDGGADFSATLAQSLAAAPAQAAAPPDATAKGSTGSDGGERSAPPAKHSGADPVAAALNLLEHALAGVLAGTPPAAAAASASAAPAGSSTSPGNHSAAAAKSTATVLAALLTQNLAGAKASGPSPSASTASSAAAVSAATPAAAGAALAAAQLTAGPHVPQQAQPDPATLTLSSPVGSSGWTDELGAKVTWMAHQGIESASLQLSPEHLGPVQVSISVHNGQASVWFGAAQPDTRTALQQSLPQLRHLFASQGLMLADAGVSRESPRGQGQQRPARTAAPVSGVATVGLDASGSRIPVPGGLGLVDTYA